MYLINFSTLDSIHWVCNTNTDKTGKSVQLANYFHDSGKSMEFDQNYPKFRINQEKEFKRAYGNPFLSAIMSLILAILSSA